MVLMYHTISYHTIPYHTIPYHIIPYVIFIVRPSYGLWPNGPAVRFGPPSTAEVRGVGVDRCLAVLSPGLPALFAVFGRCVMRFSCCTRQSLAIVRAQESGIRAL